jgi:hypothetical protein
MTTLQEIGIRVRSIETHLSDGSLAPSSAREFLVNLTALGGMVIDEVRRAELTYNYVLLNCLSGEEAANRAKIRAQCSPEYAQYREAKDLSEQIKQLIISCRGYLRSLDEEARLAR